VTRRVPTPVEVRHGNRWLAGWLLDSRHDGDQWMVFVRYRTEPGLTHIRWRPGFHVREPHGLAPRTGPSVKDRRPRR
jgi:hypothetical protein